MKPTPEQMEAYKEMAKASPDSMKAMIEANLKATCDKYAGHEDKIDDCIKYLTDCAREILGGKNGEVDNETCYRICRDYFNDEIWKAEDEEKAEREAKLAKAKKAAENTKMDSKKKKAPKKAAAKAMKVTQDFEKEQLDKERERLEKLKEKHGLAKKIYEANGMKVPEPAEGKPAEPEKPKFQMCPMCGKEFLNLYHGMCLKCYEKRPMQAEKSAQPQTAQIQTEPGQLDLFAAMGV